LVEHLGMTRSQVGVVLVATGSYLGEGFDWPELDTLFLAFPIAFKGWVVQYVGRLLRTHDDKHHVELHDYVDGRIRVLDRMHVKRRPAYSTLGFHAQEAQAHLTAAALSLIARPSLGSRCRCIHFLVIACPRRHSRSDGHATESSFNSVRASTGRRTLGGRRAEMSLLGRQLRGRLRGWGRSSRDRRSGGPGDSCRSMPSTSSG
ncbi:MAG: hypothetical protein LC749_19965, partial [Actinobacteria bacterium]|nr:hypothetical protein [Actinomycetota bacterium]